ASLRADPVEADWSPFADEEEESCPRDADVVAAWEKLINEQVDWNDWDVCDSAYVFCDGCVVKEID
ncbi:unnamed protein product, partial [Effrenium voratum]